MGHIIGFFLGFLLDEWIGDPRWIPHPVVWIGKWIGKLDRALLGDCSISPKQQRLRGFWLVLLVLLPSGILPAALLYLAYRMHFAAGVLLEAWMTCQILAAGSLRTESMKVFYALQEEDLEKSRTAVSMIVGRDTAQLDRTGVAKAAIETVAENTSDGVIAPMFYTFLGGPAGGWIYKAVNTMDSMVGYHNDRYEYFGTAAARLDDICNFLPSRLCALMMILAAAVCGKDYSAGGAFRIFRRDRYQHKSPNSAQTESVCAGALGIQLAGDASYFGKVVKKPVIGDSLREVEAADIVRANRLMIVTAWIGEAFFLLMLAAARNWL